MQKHFENPFQAQPDWHHNACIDHYLKFCEIGYYYVRAADALVQDAVKDSSLLDVYIYPVFFLYRQAVELLLKDLLWQSHYLSCGKKGFIRDKCFQTHDLLKLWQQLKEKCQTVLGADFPLISDDVKSLEDFFAQIQKHDPGSDAFRFPLDRKGARSHASLNHVNIRSLYERIHQAVDLLGDLKGIVTYCVEHCEG